MSKKKTANQPAAKPSAEKKVDHSIKSRPIPKTGGSYVADGTKLTKQNEG